MIDQGFSIRKSFRLVEVLGMTLGKRFGHSGLVPTFRELEVKWIVQEQKKAFPKLYQELEAQKRVTQLLELDPRLDQEGAIRVASGMT